MGILRKRIACGICGSQSFYEVLDFGDVPLAGDFPTKENLNIKEKYPLKLYFCEKCKLVQTDSTIDPEILFRDYRYVSSVGLKIHFENYAKYLDFKFEIKDKKVLEIGSNDGVLLAPLKKLGAKVIGVDPSINIAKMAINKGIETLNDFFSFEFAKKYRLEKKFDLILANNSFAHIDDVLDLVKGISYSLKTGGHFIFEVHYLKNLIEENQWDNIYHEHIYYYSLTALKNLFDLFGMTIVNFEEISSHSGSIRVTVLNDELSTPKIISERINEELESFLKIDRFKAFKDRALKHILELQETLAELKPIYRIAGFGASGRANIFCNLVKLDKNCINFIVDESSERSGRYISNLEIPIVGMSALDTSNIDLIVIFAWNYSKTIIEKTSFRKYKYLIPFPYPQIVDNWHDIKDCKFI